MDELSKTRKTIEDTKQSLINLEKTLKRNKIAAYIDFDDIHRDLIFQDGYTYCAEQNNAETPTSQSS